MLVRRIVETLRNRQTICRIQTRHRGHLGPVSKSSESVVLGLPYEAAERRTTGPGTDSRTLLNSLSEHAKYNAEFRWE
jgi:hypothetical protein